jgi:peptidoglycan/LPS O-acetylase OafA/YrhL
VTAGGRPDTRVSAARAIASPRLSRNNFDLLRLVFAAMVALVHVSDISGEPALNGVSRVVSSDLAVKAFFVVSGFLIVMSYERSTSWRSYAEKRVRRIYPAYAVMIVLCASLLGVVSTVSWPQYFSATWLRYLVANLTFLNFLQPTLPGVFEANKVPLVNGALWTLKVEVGFYLMVPILVWLSQRIGWRLVLGSAYLMSTVYAGVLWSLTVSTGSDTYFQWSRQLPGQLSYFVAGAALFYLLPVFERKMPLFVVSALVLLGIDQVYGIALVEPAALAVVVVAAGLFAYVGQVGKYGDLSYGVYILHFPIIQLLLHSGWFRGRPAALIAATVILTGAGAFAMWHVVEKRWLLRNSYYRVAEGSAKAIAA